MITLERFALNFFITRKILFILFLILILGIILEIWIVNRLSTYGEQISKIENGAAGLRIENQVLKNKLDLKSSLKEIEDRAKEMGFEKIKKVNAIQPPDLALIAH